MKIFSLLFGAIYYACVWQIDWALFYYYPETNKWYLTAHPDDGAGDPLVRLAGHGGVDQHPAGSAGAAPDCRSPVE